MQFSQLDSGQNVVASGSVGGGSGYPSRSTIPIGVYWNNSYTGGTAAGTFVCVMNTNGNTVGAANFQYVFERPGAITAINMTQFGPVTGTNTLQLYKNNNPLGSSINFGTNNSGTAAPPQTFANTVYRFAAGDVLSCQVTNSASGNTQVEAYSTIEWLA